MVSNPYRTPDSVVEFTSQPHRIDLFEFRVHKGQLSSSQEDGFHVLIGGHREDLMVSANPRLRVDDYIYIVEARLNGEWHDVGVVHAPTWTRIASEDTDYGTVDLLANLDRGELLEMRRNFTSEFETFLRDVMGVELT